MQIMHDLLELLGALAAAPAPVRADPETSRHRDGFAQALAAQLLTAGGLVDIVCQFLQMLYVRRACSSVSRFQ